MRNRRMLPPSVASTLWPFVSCTRNVAFGSTSVTEPSSCIASSFAIRECAAEGSARALSAAATAGGGGLELACLAGLHVVPLLPEILEDSGLGDLPLERLEGPVQPVAFFEMNLDHQFPFQGLYARAHCAERCSLEY